jgi:hypothetical protein
MMGSVRGIVERQEGDISVTFLCRHIPHLPCGVILSGLMV